MYINKHFSANGVHIQPFPFKRELSMESYLIENETILGLNSEGFGDVAIVASEEALVGGRSNTDGRIDILARYGEDCLAIVELKKGRLTQVHLDQLQDYLKERSQIQERFPSAWDTSVSEFPNWLGVLVGETIDPELMLKITQGYYFEGIPIAALTINRFKDAFSNVYTTTDVYFVEKVHGRDYTKFTLDEISYPKNRFVHAVIQKYLHENPGTTYTELIKVFPHTLQGRETFTTEELALSKPDRRNFIKPEEILTTSDNVRLAVSTQWGAGNIERFVKHVQSSLKYQIGKVSPQ